MCLTERFRSAYIKVNTCISVLQGNRGPGRPPLKRYPRGRQARNLRVTDNTQPNPPCPIASSNPPEVPRVPNHISDSTLTTDELLFTNIFAHPTGVAPLTASSNTNTKGAKPLFLERVAHDPPSWKLLGKIPTESLPDWFDAQHNDYNPQKCYPTCVVNVTWFGHPGDTPLDAIAQGKVVYRWNYVCRGACSLLNDSDDSEMYALQMLGEEGRKQQEPEEDEPMNRWQNCGTGVKLMMSTSDASSDHLAWSRRLRNIVSERFHLIGAKATTIMQEVVNQYRNPTLTSRYTNAPTEVPYEFLAFRRPNANQIRQMVPAITRYTPHEPTKPNSMSNFTCAFADNFTLESMILHGTRDGMAADSSWRNKSENRAAVIFLIAIDNNGHLTPGSALLSANVCTQTLYEYLEATKKRVQEQAQEIVTDPNSILHSSEADQAEIIAICIELLKCGWAVPKWMIYKCRAELKAIRKDAYIRLCQFHVIQAILRWECDDGSVVKGPRISMAVKYAILVHFCVLQRCRRMEEWPAAVTLFLKKVRKIIMSQTDEELEELNGDPEDTPDIVEDEIPKSDGMKPSLKRKRRRNTRGRQPKTREMLKVQYEFVHSYFSKNWFTAEWIHEYRIIMLEVLGSTNSDLTALFTDIGLPPDNRRNKRIDRLGAIILNEFFPFYQYWTGSNKRILREITELNYHVHKLWEDGQAHGIKEPEAFIVDVRTPDCRCMGFQQSGKNCVHILLAKLKISNGPASAWKELETQNQRWISRKRNKGDAREAKKISDEVHDNEFKIILGKLDKTIGIEGSGTLTAIRGISPMLSDNGEINPSCMEHFITTKRQDRRGRPPQLQPMQPWRAVKRRHVPLFSRKPGCKVTKRLAKNSLFPANIKIVKDYTDHVHEQSTLSDCKSINIYPNPSIPNEDEFASMTKLMPGSKELSGTSPVTGHDEIDPEELSMSSTDLSCWEIPAYLLRIKEMELFVEMLNILSKTCMLRTWFCLSPNVSGYLEQALHDFNIYKKSDWAQALCDAHAQQPFKRLIFLDLRNFHWMLFVHDLTPYTRDPCTSYNSLSSTSHMMDITDQWYIHNYLMSKEKIPQQIQRTFQSVSLGIQKDASNCGFWTILIAFFLLLDIPVDARRMKHLTPIELREIIGSLYINYTGTSEGLASDFVQNIFERFSPQVSLLGINILSLHPKSRSKLMHKSTKPDIQEESMCSQYSLPECGDNQVFYDIICQQKTLDFFIDHKFPITAAKIEQVRKADGRLCDAILNAYLHLWQRDMSQLSNDPYTFKIFDTILANRLWDTPTKVDFKPPGTSRKGKPVVQCWVPDVSLKCDKYCFINFDMLPLPG
ncbi:hypothetical protein K439DRAFT_1612645 [Ramaria rubella]|nr:hypothetical protein K439DRAFT_1612645 [Ramaria rubella]